MNFTDLGLHEELSSRLAGHNITSPSQIQQESFSLLREGQSVVALSKTGTGKTLAYLAPLIQRYVYDLKDQTPDGKAWGLILVPTRELADQAEKNLQLLCAQTIASVVIVGGESEKRQIEVGSKAAIYIATPGRFLDLLERRLVQTDSLKCVVFDEADRILDMGFVNDIRKIRRLLPKQLQLCFFSATIHFGIDEIAYEFGVEAQRIGKEQEDLTVEGLDHRVAFVGDHEKFHALVNFLHKRPGQRGIVFTNYRERAEEIVTRLRGLGLRCEFLTAKLSQAERTRTMSNFREGRTQLLVASDLAARGLDVQDLDFVVNMALPEDSATYLHRVGRTARAGKKGIAVSMVGFDDSFRLEALEKFLGKGIPRFEFPAEELEGPLKRFGPRAADSNERRERPQQNHAARSETRPARPNRPKHPRQDHHDRQPHPHSHQRHQTNRPRPEASHSNQVKAPPVKVQEKKSFFGKLIDSVKKVFGIHEEVATPRAETQQRNSSHSRHHRRHQQHPQGNRAHPHRHKHRPRHRPKAKNP